MVRTVAGRPARDRRRGTGISMVTLMTMPVAKVTEAAVIIAIPVLVQVRMSRPDMTISSARSDIGVNWR